MSIVSVQPKSFILALFIRDDNERFLLGDNGYDFKDSQLHFAANTIENDEVQKQGADGVMIAGQVRRASVQSFDGFVGDATMAKETIEQMRRDFIAFFLKGHHYRVIYVDCNRNAWQRKGGYLVDAPEVKELWQIHPEYHVGLNFEDVNYYSYDEDADGNEILANLVNVPVSTEAEGGLVWDEDGAVSENAGDISYDEEIADATPAKNVYITDATEAPLASFQLDGETSQNGTPTPSAPVAVQTVIGENEVKICGKNLFDKSIGYSNTTIDAANGNIGSNSNFLTIWAECQPNTTYTISKGAPTTRFVVADSTKIPQAGDHCNVLDGYNSQSTSKTITTSSSAKYLIAMVKSGQDTLSQQAILDFMQIELGSTATAYEPYQVQSYEVNLGKNLFNKDNSAQILNNTYIHAQGMGTSNGFATVYIPCDEGVVYTISKVLTSRFSTGTTTTVPAVGVIVSSIVADNSATKMTYTTGAGSRYLVVQVRSSSDTLTVDEIVATIQIEKGSQATSYAAYFTPIELCKIGDYQDYIWNDNGTWKKHKAVGKVIYNGTEDWRIYNDFMFLYEPSFILSYGNNGYMPTNYLADNFTRNSLDNAFSDRDASYLVQNVWGERDKQRGVAMLTNSTFTDLSAWKTWLGSHNTTIYYQLDNPTEEEITNQALITQLDNVASAPLYTGVNNITTITPNEQGTLEISYYTKYQPMVGSGGYVWEAGGAGGPTIIMNNSIDNVSPVWTIYGPTTNPQLENATTGETIEYVGTIAQGQTLTIDMGEQTASLDGLNVISNLVGDFIQLAPGRNNMIYSVSGEAGASELGWSEIVG